MVTCDFIEGFSYCMLYYGIEQGNIVGRRKIVSHVRSEVLIVMSIKIIVFWDGYHVVW
jgi:hypothetical protein